MLRWGARPGVAIMPKLLVSSAVMLGGIVMAPLTAGLSLLAAPPVQLATLIHMENRAPDRTR